MPTNPDLAALSAAATPGTWETDTLNSEGSYGSGDDTYEGYATTAIYDASGKVLFDALNSDAILVQEEWDEDGGSAYDLTSAANAAFIITLVNACRTGNLVQINPEGMRERVARSIAPEVFARPRINLFKRDYDKAYERADAAIAALLGGEHDRAV